MKLEEIKKYVSNRIIVVCASAFMLVALLSVALHVFIMPFLISTVSQVSIRWLVAGMAAFLVLVVGAFAVYWVSKLDVERKQVEEVLRDSEEISRGILESAATAIYIAQEGKFQYVSPLFEEMTGYTADKTIGMYSIEYVHPEDREAVRKGAIENLKGLSGSPHEFRFLRKDGTTVWLLEKVASIRYRGEQAAVGSLMDITERKQAEERMRQAAEEWRTTFDSISDLVSIHDRDFKLTRVNKAFANLFKMGPKELIGKTCYEVVHGIGEPWPNCPHKKALKTKRANMAEFFDPNLSAYLEVSVSPVFNDEGEVIATVHVTKDITERKRGEEQLVVTDRLASIGELVAGIAHELNNPLTSVIGFSQLLMDKDDPSDVKEDLKIICSEAQRAAGVVKNLLTFARKHPPVKQPVNINDIVEKVLELRAYEQKVNNIQVNTDLTPDLPEIMADYFQLQQVFLNIVINAEHFMIEAHNGGTLTIITGSADNTIRVIFNDDGPGISKETLGHLFDPFFTTKEVGKGTGLGLSICHGIMIEHGGRIYAESELGKGATFVVELPIGEH
jgi:PAS domain S-box-containing protein